ncbi:MAG: carbohydrate ABC transporter permease [Candidatus Izemoplasmataceae bacterium]|jgi:raffinose/stachyose/melibiose transport system permease protein|uniref:carbohydrate ABC transporter permease n=1 Tax=Liberiplasma polymorphum TaxID=3374570 RepID=UPI0037724735
MMKEKPVVKYKAHRHPGLIITEVFAVGLLLLFFAPFVIVLINSSKSSADIISNPINLPESWRVLFTNISAILRSSQIRYGQSFMNSVIITTLSLLFIGISSAMAAWVLVRTKTKVSFAIFMFIISGLVIPFQVVMLPLVRLLEVFDILTGIPFKDTHHGVILAYMGFGAPLSVFLFHGFIKSIPLDIEEAAIIDGCSKPQVFFRIVLPILKPIFVTLLVLNGMWIWNDYLLPLLVIGVGGSTQTLPLAVANLAGAFVRQWDLILTAVLMAAMPVVILFLIAQKYIIKGMTSGAIK